jgi:hypothetical protein
MVQFVKHIFPWENDFKKSGSNPIMFTQILPIFLVDL